jgi:T4-like virus tail tube protein gp19
LDLAAFGSVLETFMPQQPQQPTQRSTSTGHFECKIDGGDTPFYLKSVDGGFVKASVIDEPIGLDLVRIKHTSVREVDPIGIEVGLAGSKDILNWIRASWKRDWSRRNGHIIHANYDQLSVVEQWYYDALLMETTFPALDGNSKDPSFLKVKFQPERVELKPGDNKHLGAGLGTKQKTWQTAGFRLRIDGVEVTGTQKIESFTIKQGVKRVAVGNQRFQELEPTKIEFPGITGYIAHAKAGALVKWYNEFVVNQSADPAAERNGALEFLAADKSTVLFTIKLAHVGLSSLSIPKSDGNQDAIRMCKFELYVGSMDIEEKGAGFE